MKNRILLAILAIMLVFSMAVISCGGGETPGTGNPGGTDPQDGNTPGSSGDWTLVPSFGAAAIAYGNGKFVACSYNEIATSPDGITWTKVKENTGWGTEAIAYGEGKGFVAAGQTYKDDSDSKYYSIIAYSSDGTTWETTKIEGFYYAIAYGGGVFVIVGSKSENQVAWSTDGKNWTAVDTSSLKFLNTNTKQFSIAYGGGKFVENAFGYYVVTSPDGKVWTIQNGDKDIFTFTAIAYGGDKFVAGGYNSFSYSSDGGATWTKATMSGTGDIKAIAYGNNKFVAVGRTDISAMGNIFTSSNGESWTAVEGPKQGSYGVSLNTIAYGNNRFVVAASGSLYYSKTGF